MIGKITKLGGWSYILSQLGMIALRSEVRTMEVKSARVYVELTSHVRKIFIAVLAALVSIQICMALIIILGVGLLTHSPVISQVNLLWSLGSLIAILAVLIYVICSQRFWFRVMRVKKILDWALRS